jgi:6-phosphogluconate dehydrogenase
LGLIGLAVMGENLALNIESRGYSVSVYNRTVSRVDEFVSGRGAGKRVTGCRSLPELVESLSRPRKIILMVKAGEAVDEVVGQILPLLEPDDILIDCGNSYYKDTGRRSGAMRKTGVHFLGVGVSGGEEGALHGPSIMAGGDYMPWLEVRDLFHSIAAKAGSGNDEPCCEWMGLGGAGHFVKMVHNAIEYADMQLISEAYWLLKTLMGMKPSDIHDVFARWNEGPLQSYLIEITSLVLGKKDELTDDYLIDVVLDAARQKGTGAWAAEAAFQLGVPTPSLVEAVVARFMSALKDERVAAAVALGRFEGCPPAAPAKDFVPVLHDALYTAKLIAYAQGFALMQAASAKYDWPLDYAAIARTWRNGCIIRARFLDDIAESFGGGAVAKNLLLAPMFAGDLARLHTQLRLIVGASIENGVPVPGLASALGYYDSYRSANLPANLIQAQRDCFGAHGYERKDREGVFHSKW